MCYTKDMSSWTVCPVCNYCSGGEAFVSIFHSIVNLLMATCTYSLVIHLDPTLYVSVRYKCLELFTVCGIVKVTRQTT